MGLAITAYSHVEFIEEMSYDDFEEKYESEDNWEQNQDKKFIWPEQDYPERLGSIKPGGVYRVIDSFGFGAGSYSGYNWWREQLSMMALGVMPCEVWNNPEKYEEAPFYPLINFNDNEGVMGPEVSLLLAKDFANFQEKAEQWQTEPFFIEAYNDWRKAFELASKGGFVDFH